MVQSTINDKVNQLVNDLLKADSVEEAFCGFLLETEESQRVRKESCMDMVKKFWVDVPQETLETALRSFVTTFHSQANTKRAKLLLDTLESLVEANLMAANKEIKQVDGFVYIGGMVTEDGHSEVKVRRRIQAGANAWRKVEIICDVLMTSEKLTYKVADKWCLTFKLVRRIIGGVDYKGCRDLLRLMLEKAQGIPNTDNIYTLKLVEAVYDVVKYILDRNTCLLPSYFAVNEITKLSVEDKHWKLGQLLADFVQTFRHAASLVTVAGRCKLLPIVGHSSPSNVHVWQLNTSTLRFPLSGPLPYDKELCEPQIALLRYVLEQPYSRDMVCQMLSLNKQVKQRCPVLEEELTNLVVLAMERSEVDEDGNNQLLWQHLSSQVIFFVLFQFTSFTDMVLGLYNKLKGRNLRKGRDHLMWVLLQFISGSIQRNKLEEFLPVLKLYDLLYPEKTMLDLPDVNQSSCTHKMACTCIWIHLEKKAQSDKMKLHRPMPLALKGHTEFLTQCLHSKNLPMTDYKIALLCNAYSTNTDIFSLPMGILVESIYGNGQLTTVLPGSILASAPTQPLPMSMLDSLTVHAKMSLIHSIVTRVMRLAKAKSNTALAPALVETYSRLLVYMEIESLGIKGFISQLLPSVFGSNAWGILHTLLEMFSYRLHHIQPHYRVQLLSHLHSLASVPQTNQNQLHLCIESTALRLIMGLGSWEVQPQLSRVFSEPKTMQLLSSDSEELNKALVLTLARSMHVTGYDTSSGSRSKESGTWWKDILTTILQYTPHSWSSHTLACFPSAISDFFHQNAIQREDKVILKRNVDAEYRKWKSMASENDLVTHFSVTAPGTPQLFLCILWRSLLEDNRIAPTAYKVLERLGPRSLSGHLRTFADYLVYEFSTSAGGQHVNKCVEALNDLIWKCNIISIDRLVLCLVLRNLEGNEAQVSFFIIQLLLLKPSDFRNRVLDFVKENSPEHWLQTNWHEKHMSFHTKYPEKFYFEGLQDMTCQSSPHQYLPIYFGNVCLRFLPVFDIVIHRFLELPPVTKSLETILDHIGGLYKFHDRPVTYLYNTLHYYDHKLRDRPALKKKLVHSIIGSQKDIRPAKWCLSDDYQQYLQKPPEDTSWTPEPEYYVRLVGRIVDTIKGVAPPPFPNCDWRFNEFPNPAAHALHATCIELMALPVSCQAVSGALLNIVLKGAMTIPRENIMSWMNAIGLVLTALPDGYWTLLNSRIINTLQHPTLMTPNPDNKPFLMFNFSGSHQVIGEQHCGYLLALCHAIWHHASIGQLSSIPQFIRDVLKPLIKTEDQMLFVCHLVGPFLRRFHVERTRCLLELTVELYEILQAVDKCVEHLHYMDAITDFLYHIKYMFVGNGVKNEVEKVIPTLRPALQLRLRFISHHFKEEAPNPS